MLTETEKLAAYFTALEEHDFEVLLLLGLINKYTTETQVKELTRILERDRVVSSRRSAALTAAQNEARAENPEPDSRDPDAWYYIGDTGPEFSALAIVEEMNAEERAELRRRVLGR